MYTIRNWVKRSLLFVGLYENFPMVYINLSLFYMYKHIQNKVKNSLQFVWCVLSYTKYEMYPFVLCVQIYTLLKLINTSKIFTSVCLVCTPNGVLYELHQFVWCVQIYTPMLNPGKIFTTVCHFGFRNVCLVCVHMCTTIYLFKIPSIDFLILGFLHIDF